MPEEISFNESGNDEISRFTFYLSRPIQSLIIISLLFSCSPFRHSTFSYHDNNGTAQTADIIVPKKYNRTEVKTDSAGNEQKYFYYPGGKVLYFVRLTDSLKEIQPINMEENIPRTLYGTMYMKGIDNSGRYWRENRNFPFKSGYRYVGEGSDWMFDSSLNYFTNHGLYH